MPKVFITPSIPLADRFGGALAARYPSILRSLGNLETRLLRDEMASVRIERPVYVCGLARAGTTLLLEMLAAAPDFTSLRYADYPMLWTPYWWNWLRKRLPTRAQTPQMRAHRDRIEVTRESAEALEEPLWMQFFPNRHVAAVDQVLRAEDANAAFDRFYDAQLRKLLAVRGRPRYLAKGNYNLARLSYLQRLYPDALFVVAVREPMAQVASLLRQDELFTRWAKADPHIAQQMARSGHFEFGPQKRVEHLADTAEAARIAECFASDRLVEGYARQWVMSYGWLHRQLTADANLAQACLIVRFDELCAEPAGRLADLFAHVGLRAATARELTEQFAPRISTPAYYRLQLTPSERELVDSIASPLWHLLRR